jgi:hypothetical protein
MRHTPETHAYEIGTHEMPAREMHVHKTHAHKIGAHRKYACETYTHEAHAYGGILRGSSESEHRRTPVPSPARVSALSHIGFNHRVYPMRHLREGKAVAIAPNGATISLANWNQPV